MSKHLVIFDIQDEPNECSSYLAKFGELIIKEKPDVIICIGDFADMKSLGSFDKPGSKKFEGRRYKDDIASANIAMCHLLQPLWSYNELRRHNKKKQYKPRLVMTLGNHEERINRAINADPTHLEGIISMEDLNYEAYGWEVYPFLDRVTVDGVCYSHYFVNPSSMLGRPVGGTIDTKLKALGHSFTMGHQQILQYGVSPRQSGILHGLVCGASYAHDEDYLGPQGNDYWRGVAIKDNVKNGEYDLRLMNLQTLLG